MTPRFNALRNLAIAIAPFFVVACTGGTPKVSGHSLVIPDRSPSRAVQALDAPSADGTSSGSNANAYCLNGQAGPQTQNDDGSFSYEWDCAAGGGIASVTNAGSTDPNTGDGAYDQTTVYEDGSSKVWHFTIDTSDDFLTQSYTGVSDDGSETYEGTYVFLDQVNGGHYNMSETWNLHEGTYATAGITNSTDGSFDGTQEFDDPNTAASPDWTADEVNNADGTFSQVVHFNGDGFVSDYSYAVDGSGAADYSFVTDLSETSASPDYSGAYNYNADGSGEGGYHQLLDDGSTDDIHDVINSDGSVHETWSFDDVNTDQGVDQEGDMLWSVDGSAEGTVTTHVVGGGDQTCQVHIGADGSSTVDNCE